MRKSIAIAFLLLCGTGPARAQSFTPAVITYISSTSGVTCTPGLSVIALFVLNVSPYTTYYCSAANTLSALGGASQVYPGAGVANSTGSAWGTSYTVGTAANNLVQLNGSSQLPAVSAALLTNFPTFNQNTTGSAGSLSATLGCGQFPALTGDTTTSSGSCATATAKINGTAFAGTSGDLVTFGTGNTPADSAILATSLAPLISPTFTGIPAAPTAAAGTSTTQLATTAFVNAPLTMYSPQTGVAGASATTTANEFNIVGEPVNATQPMSFGHFIFSVQTADGSNNSDFGLATGTPGGTCTLLLHVGATTYASTGPVSSAQSWTLPANVTQGTARLYFVWTSAAATVKPGGTQALSFATKTASGTTTGGSLGTPGSTTFTCPADAWNIPVVPGFYGTP
jgi:hypothetical protein